MINLTKVILARADEQMQHVVMLDRIRGGVRCYFAGCNELLPRNNRSGVCRIHWQAQNRQRARR